MEIVLWQVFQVSKQILLLLVIISYKNYIGEMLTLGSLKGYLNNDFKESRFSKGEVCPHCQSTSIVKNGKLNGKQRYLCKSCKKSFNDLTKSVFILY